MPVFTKVLTKHFNKDVEINVIKSSDSEDRYCTYIEKDDHRYIVIGYKISLNNVDTLIESSKNDFLISLEKISKAHQEYYYNQVLSQVNTHFPKPLEIDYEINPLLDAKSCGILYIEILYDYCGEPISKLDNLNAKRCYELMWQSASALGLLHNFGFNHVNINPNSMIFDEKTGKLVILDTVPEREYKLGYNPQIGNYLEEFAPPEILNPDKNNPPKIASTNTYLWAMSYYATIMKKKPDRLKYEIEKLKKKSEMEYEKFLNEFVKIDNELNEQEPDMKELSGKIEKIIKNGMELFNENRLNMLEVMQDVKDKKNQDKINSNVIYYENDKVDLDLTLNKFMFVEYKELQQHTHCLNCHRQKDVKAKLQCGHVICRNCFMNDIKNVIRYQEDNKNQEENKRAMSINQVKIEKNMKLIMCVECTICNIERLRDIGIFTIISKNQLF